MRGLPPPWDLHFVNIKITPHSPPAGTSYNCLHGRGGGLCLKGISLSCFRYMKG